MNKINNKLPDQGQPFHKDVLNVIMDLLNPIDFLEIVGLAESDMRRKHYLVETIEAVLKAAVENGYPFSISNGIVYLYNGAFWSKLEVPGLERFFGQAAIKLGVDKYYSDHHEFRTELVKQLYTFASISNPNSYAGVKINLLNGTLTINNKGEYGLMPFNPIDFFTYQLQFPFDKAASCNGFHQFLDRVLPDKEQQLILGEYIGYVFIKHHILKVEKCMVLYGSGANGKSVFYEIISALLGSHNISNYSLKALTNGSGYYRAHLGNKLLNYGSEISAHMDPELFKQLVSGESVGARLPYREPFDLVDYGKLMFNANSLPNDVEQNDAFFRRFLIIKFGVTIPEADRDPELAKKIIETELPGIFNWVLEGLDRLMHNKKFTKSVAVDLNVKEYKDNSDSVSLFLRDESYRLSEEHWISLKTLNDEYRRYSLSSGYKPITRNELSRRLVKFDFEMRRRAGGMFVAIEKKV